MKKNQRLTVFAIMLLLSIYMVACAGDTVYPSSEILFISEKGMGFINPNGADPSFVTVDRGLSLFFWGKPMITSDGMQVILLGSQASYPVQAGNIYIAKPGTSPFHCKQWGRSSISLSEDQKHVFAESEQGIMKHAIKDCGKDTNPTKIYEGIFGKLSPDEKFVAQVNWVAERQAMINVKNIETGKEIIVMEGNLPAWSRDSQSLAYTGIDGIYVFHIAKAEEPQKVATHLSPTGPDYPLYYERSPWYYPPVASWSPDGRWLVYHVYGSTTPNQAAISVSVYDIYNINLVTGEKTKLFGGGIFPFWRSPADKE
jgi:hypothetical protein